MLIDYIQAAMEKAKYEILADGEGFYASIPEMPGVWANAPALEECRRELQEVIEDWMLIKLRHNDPLPVIDGIDLNLPAPSEQEVG